jgi:hypothetical protein
MRTGKSGSRDAESLSGLFSAMRAMAGAVVLPAARPVAGQPSEQPPYPLNPGRLFGHRLPKSRFCCARPRISRRERDVLQINYTEDEARDNRDWPICLVDQRHFETNEGLD